MNSQSPPSPTKPGVSILLLFALTGLVSCQSNDWAQAKPALPAAPVAPVSPPVPASLPSPPAVTTVRTLSGKASWYSIACNGGTQTASGERLRDHGRTAAHKSLPMGTRVRVTNTRNGKSAIVKINDRGPYTRGRIIDVTKGVANDLGMITAGVAPVKVEVLKKSPPAYVVNSSQNTRQERTAMDDSAKSM